MGGLAVYFLVKPQIMRAETEAATERLRANDGDASRQRLEIEIAAVRGVVDRIGELTAKSEKDRLTILDLTEKHSAATASVEDRNKAITNLTDQIAAMSEAATEYRKQLTDLEIARAAMSSTITEREAALRKEREQFDETKAAFHAQFAELSAEALRDNGEKFLETAKRVLALQHQVAESDLSKRQEEIKNLVRPIEEGIKAVSNAAREMEEKRATAFGTIEEQLRQSVASAAEVAKQAVALKDALKRPNVRGRWGEVQLKICVELAGMEEHCDVEFQETSLSEDDEALRPDMIVRMPGGRKILIPHGELVRFSRQNHPEAIN
jgi:DNA recombination protein RmuC